VIEKNGFARLCRVLRREETKNVYPELRIFSFSIDNYLFLYLVGIAVSAILLKCEMKRNNYSTSLYTTVLVAGITAGIIGSKIYYLFEAWDQFLHSPLQTFFSTAGSGWYGGFLFGGAAIVLTLKIKEQPVLKFLDLIIPVVPVGQVFGRFGCFLTGCCGGRPSNVPWAVSFPNGTYAANVKVHPTQLYEMALYSAVAVLLWKLRKKETGSGSKFGLYLVLVGLGRFTIEFYRVNSKVLLGLTAPQLFALLSILLGGYLLARGRTRACEIPNAATG
jgi:phosphatidylglycerol:prolipoprotein diacylglycerol transferase